MGIALMAVAGFIAKKRGYPVDAPVAPREIFRRFLAALPSLFLVVLVMGGIIGGAFTATEAGAIAVVYSFVLAVPVYREVTLRDIPKVLVDAAINYHPQSGWFDEGPSKGPPPCGRGLPNGPNNGLV